MVKRYESRNQARQNRKAESLRACDGDKKRVFRSVSLRFRFLDAFEL